MAQLGRAALLLSLGLVAYALVGGSLAAYRRRRRLALSARNALIAAFMRAAYGKGYCDALTEDSPGSLCHDHGYRVPGRRVTAPADGA